MALNLDCRLANKQLYPQRYLTCRRYSILIGDIFHQQSKAVSSLILRRVVKMKVYLASISRGLIEETETILTVFLIFKSSVF